MAHDINSRMNREIHNKKTCFCMSFCCIQFKRVRFLQGNGNHSKESKSRGDKNDVGRA